MNIDIEKIGFYLYMQEQEEKKKATANDRNSKSSYLLEREQRRIGRKFKKKHINSRNIRRGYNYI